MSSQKGMIVAQIDARGTGYQGELLRAAIKNKLGSVEIEDQLSVLKYLRDNLKVIQKVDFCPKKSIKNINFAFKTKKKKTSIS